MSRFFLLSTWAVGVFTAGTIFIYLHAFKKPQKTDPERKGDLWFQQAGILSIAIFLLGTFPVWITRKQMTIGMYSDRFALAGMFGASIFIVFL